MWKKIVPVKRGRKSTILPSLKEEIEMQITQNLSLSSLIVNVASAKIALIGLTNGYTTIVTSLVGTTSSGNKHIFLFTKSPAYSHTLSILGTTIRRESKRISYNRRSIDDVVNPTFSLSLTTYEVSNEVKISIK